MKQLAIFFLLLISGLAFAQTHDITWFDSEWKNVETKDKALYYRITVQDSLTKLYIVEDHNVTGEIIRTGSFVSFNPEIREGRFIWYFKNGRKNKEVLYQNNIVKEWAVWNEKKKIQLSVVLSFKGPNGEELFEAFKVDKSPEYVGGTKAMKIFIDKNIVYPPSTKLDPIEGTVVVYVNVGEDGKLKGAKVIRPVHPDVDAEALRIVSIMPDWKPGTVEGRPVTIPYAIPIIFRNRSSQDYSRTRTTNPNL